MVQRRTGSRRFLPRWLATLATFHFVCLAWIFFRAPTLAHAGLALGRLLHGAWALVHVTPRVPLLVAAALLLHLVPRDWEARARDAFTRTPAFVQGLVLAGFALGLHAAAGTRAEPFVYGQF
jgi:hypothetical protein